MIPRIAVAAAAASLALAGTPAAPAVADTIRDRQWQLTDLNIADVHRITRGAGVTVAVLDTGVDATHPDLKNAVLAGDSTFNDSWDDGTGRDDLDGHGTAMAGLIAGRGHGSGDGVLGIAPAARILPIAAPTNLPSSSSFMTVAVDFAIAHHARVINMSFGRSGDQAMHEAIRKAAAADIVVVGASGNRDKPGDYPGKYPEVLTVGAYGKNRAIAAFSVTGPQVDLVAPGDQIIVASAGSTGYKITRGTSQATAIVSGAAALIRAKYPKLNAAEVVHRLTATADSAGAPGRDDTYGYGRLDILKALTTDVAALPAPSSPAAPATTATNPTTAGGSHDLPKPANPLWLALILAGLVLITGLITVAALRRRQTSQRHRTP